MPRVEGTFCILCGERHKLIGMYGTGQIYVCGCPNDLEAGVELVRYGRKHTKSTPAVSKIPTSGAVISGISPRIDRCR